MPFSLMLANLRRAPVRNALAVFSLCAGTVTVVLLDGVSAAFRNGLQEELLYSQTRHWAILPGSEFAKIAQVPGVAAVTPQLSAHVHYQRPSEGHVMNAIDPQAYFAIFGLRMADATRECMMRSRSGMIAQRALAERLDWRPGTRIPLLSRRYPPVGADAWTFEFCGAFDAPPGDGAETRWWEDLLVRFDYVSANDYAPGELAAQFLIRTAPGFDPRRVAADIDALFASQHHALRTAPFDVVERRQRGTQAEWGAMTALAGIASALATALITACLMSQTLAGRAAEFRVLRAVGFTQAAVAGLIFSEAGLLAVAGAAAGAMLAWAFEPWLQSLLFAAIGAFELRPAAAGAAALGALALGLATAIAPARRALRRGSVDPQLL